ncbi:MAG: hypothetical protein NXH95_07510 [Pseudomonadaceae bacterium]|nr:hypothetical protein [Pseudomonadaceae bacterium]
MINRNESRLIAQERRNQAASQARQKQSRRKTAVVSPALANRPAKSSVHNFPGR